MITLHRRSHARALAVAICLSPIAIARAQVRLGPSTCELVAVNTDAERYLRVLQDAGIVRAYPWSVRELGSREVESLLPADSTHPWRSRVHASPNRSHLACVLAPEVQATYNTTFPYGENDGALWAGRGLTSAVQFGFLAHFGPLSITAEPIAFRAENQKFRLVPTGSPGRLQFADAFHPTSIDQPQRFGDGAYQRLDPGQTTIRLDLPYVAVGASTANQVWGPAIENPIILGNNAAGFPHAFIGTSAPVDLYLVHLQGRVEWGILQQSDFAVLQGTQSRRFMSGIVASITPRGFDNLEIGGARFFHTLWPDSGLTAHDFLRPFEGLLLSSVAGEIGGTGQEPDNQLASVFARLVAPGDRFELYAEYGREDHNIDLRDLTLEPDHDAAYVIGFQKAVRLRDSSLLALHAEIVNSRISHLQLGRPQTPFYVHSPVVQGHTEEGQILGSPSVYGGGGFSLGAERYDPAGQWSVSWDKIDRAERLGPDGLPDPRGADVMHSLTVQRTMFRARADLTAGLTLTNDFNRNFVGDARNAQLVVGVRPHW